MPWERTHITAYILLWGPTCSPHMTTRHQTEAPSVRLDIFEHHKAFNAVVVTARSANGQPHAVRTVVAVPNSASTKAVAFSGKLQQHVRNRATEPK